MNSLRAKMLAKCRGLGWRDEFTRGDKRRARRVTRQIEKRELTRIIKEETAVTDERFTITGHWEDGESTTDKGVPRDQVANIVHFCLGAPCIGFTIIKDERES